MTSFNSSSSAPTTTSLSSSFLAYTDERMQFVVWSCIVANGAFWGANLFFFLIDRLGWFAKYKIQQAKYPPWPLVKHCLFDLIRNHFIVRPLLLYVTYPFFVRAGVTYASRPYPSVPVIFAQFLFFLLCNETGFYWTHRMCHLPSLYKHIHKKHHEFNVSIGIAAEYAHPVEQILCNIGPTIMGPLILGAHTHIMWAWIALRLFATVDAHSGYQLPFSPFSMYTKIQGGAERHDFHHSHNIGCFGANTCLWDKFCGTDAAFNQFKAAEKGGNGQQQQQTMKKKSI